MSDEKTEDKTEVAKRRLNVTLSSFTMFSTPRTRKDKKQLRLTWECTNGYPNVNVEADEEGEATKENGYLRLSARLNGTNFYGYLRLLEMALTKEPGWKRAVNCYHTYKDGVQHPEPVHVNDLVVGVDNQGLVYTTILQAGRTSSKYVFGPTDFHNWIKEDGSPWSQKEINQLCVQGTIDGLRSAMGAAIAFDAMDYQNQRSGLPSPSVKPSNGFSKPDGDGNSGGNGNNNYNRNYSNNNNNGYQKRQWQGNNNGGQGGYNKKPWQGNNNNSGGYNRNNYNNGGNRGYGNNQGGFQKGYGNNNGNGGQNGKWDNNRNQGSGQTQQNQQRKTEDEFDDIEF